MNYAKIKKEYPKAYTLLDRLYKDRDLYDFFDKQGIVLCVHRTHDEYFTWYIDRSEFEHRRPRTTTRTEAEEVGFEECFKILERKLQ